MQLNLLGPGGIAAFGDWQVSALTAAQLQGFTLDQVAAIANAAALTTPALQSLDDPQTGALTQTQLAQLGGSLITPSHLRRSLH